jgi:hypothetical protein
LVAFSEPPSDYTWLENALTRINPCGALQGKPWRNGLGAVMGWEWWRDLGLGVVRVK